MKIPARIGLASLLLGLFANEAGAQADYPFEIPRSGGTAVTFGLNFRNGDWVTVNALGVVVHGAPVADRCVAAAARGELGLGGSGVGIGLAIGLFSEACVMPNFLFSGILTVDAHVERMYWPTSWRSTTYVGPQITFSGIVSKISLGWMYDVHDGANKHAQLGLGIGW